MTDETPKPPPVTDEVIINQTEGGATTPQEDRRPINKSWTDPVGGPFAIVVFLVLLAVTAATFFIMHEYKESVPYAFGFLGSVLIPLIMAYQGYQGFKTRRTLHAVADRVEQSVNRVSRETTDDVKGVIKDEAKKGVKELATEHPPVVVAPFEIPAAALTPVEPQPATEPVAAPKRRPWHRRIKPQ